MNKHAMLLLLADGAGAGRLAAAPAGAGAAGAATAAALSAAARSGAAGARGRRGETESLLQPPWAARGSVRALPPPAAALPALDDVLVMMAAGELQWQAVSGIWVTVEVCCSKIERGQGSVSRSRTFV